MAFDFKKEYKEFYLPPQTPILITVPPMQYVAVRGRGDPNAETGEYQRALGVLYALAYTIKMSKRSDRRMDGYFDFVVPPLEGFWWQEQDAGVDFQYKDQFRWIAMIRLPDFVTADAFAWAKEQAKAKKKLACDSAELLRVSEGLCVQMLHLGSFDAEPASIRKMEDFAQAQGFRIDLGPQRRHHEIYLSDARKVAPEKWRTVLRLPIAPKEPGNDG